MKAQQHAIGFTIVRREMGNGIEDSADSGAVAHAAGMTPTDLSGEVFTGMDIWESGVLAPGESFELALETEGSYSVYHGLDAQSLMDIEVSHDAPAPTPEPDGSAPNTPPGTPPGTPPDAPSEAEQGPALFIFVPAVTGE